MFYLELYVQKTGGSVEIGELPTIEADPFQMRQLLQNLIVNPLKFHRPQIPPVIKIYSQFLNNQADNIFANSELCQIIVEDNGIGFEEKYFNRIFNVFQPLHSSIEYEGTGIGLAREALGESQLPIELYIVSNDEHLMDYLYHRGRYANNSSLPHPDLNLLDLNMPRIGGLEALKEIKTDPQLRRIPVVIMSTSRREEDIYNTSELGANSFITQLQDKES